LKQIIQIAIVLFSFLLGNEVYSQTSVEFPNVITPNGDGMNDEFLVKSSGYVKMDGVILNRRGETIINFFGLNAKWDGRTSSGDRVMDGVYFYKISLTREDGEIESYMGNIQVLGRR
jgi:gliding motility-associated-like protein